MRQRLMDATVACLVEHGWAATTTTMVSERAGVSRGAQLHHFPTKHDLVMAAVDHLIRMRGEALREAGTRLPTGEGRTRQVLEVLADHFTSDVFVAALELWTAARTDAQLLAMLGPLERELGRETHFLTIQMLGLDDEAPRVRELIQATLDLIRGLGLANTITDDRKRRGYVLDEWAATLNRELELK